MTRLYGTARIGGTLFWATRFEEEVTSERSGGKAFGGGATATSYRYFANFAMGLCEGEVTAIRRVWADGQPLDLSGVEMRLYRGTADQMPDPLIEAKQGAGQAPAYRNTAYVVFERLALDDFGNRIPVLQFEVVRAIGALEKQIEAVTIIPGATEHGYAPTQVTETTGPGASRILNRNVGYAGADDRLAGLALDELQALCPNLKRVSLVVSWFGTDLRAGECRVVPGVEVASRADESQPWQVSGVSRGVAHVVSQVKGGPAYGGTPNDAAVLAAIADLKARGLGVTLYPLMMMDIPADNGLPDPYGGNRQAAIRGAGRITAMTDRSAGTRAAIDAFCGTAAVSDFAVGGGVVSYTGSGEGYRRMILHYAHLAALAGGVHSFIIGSEMRGLTRLRDQAGAFPFVEVLTALAADVRGIWVVASSSPMLPTGANIPDCARTMVRATSSSISIRSGRARLSTRSASTIIGRWPTGATTICTRPVLMAQQRPTIATPWRAPSPEANISTGIMPATPRGKAAADQPSRMARLATVGLSRQGHWQLVGEPALRAVGRDGTVQSDRLAARDEAGSGSPSSAARGRAWREPAECLSRSEIGRKRSAAFFFRPAQRRHAAAFS